MRPRDQRAVANEGCVIRESAIFTSWGCFGLSFFGGARQGLRGGWTGERAPGG